MVIGRRQVMVVTDRPDGVADLVEALSASGYFVSLTPEVTGRPLPDLALIDVTSGRHWTTARSAEGARRILIVQSAPDVRRAFDLGADDCVLAGAEPEEVAARCEAALRRTSQQPGLRPMASVYVDRRLWINFDSRQVWLAGTPVHLTPREFRLLRFLIQHRGERLTHARILEAVWERDTDSSRPTEVLKQYIWRLRQKLEDDPDRPATIVTDAGEGYRFVAHPA